MEVICCVAIPMRRAVVFLYSWFVSICRFVEGDLQVIRCTNSSDGQQRHLIRVSQGL